MTSAVRKKSPRRGRRSAEQMIVGALIILGVVASVFLVFSESVQLLRVGLVAALWAAIVGAIAMTKFRREAAMDKAKARDLQKVYELQLEREITARREYELGVEAKVRREVRADAEELAGLRAELVALRANLQFLFDGQLPVDRIALHADSTRVGELTGRPTAPPEPAYLEGGKAPRFASPFDEPVTAETAIVLENDNEPVPVPKKDRDGKKAKATEASDGTSTKQKSKSDDAKKADPDAGTAKKPTPEPAESAKPDDTSEPTVELPEPRRRRRAADDGEDSTGSMSVAQILANIRSENEAQAGTRRG